MTELARGPIGLPPRRPTPVQNLVKANRTSTPADTTREVSLTQKLERPTTGAQHAPQPADEASKDDAGVKPQQVTFYMDPEDLGRAKSAYRATGGTEGDRTWSNFIASAVLAETYKRQEKYNNSQPFKNDNKKLPPGRKI